MEEHSPVLLDEAVNGLALSPGDLAIDLTTGLGGHTARLLEAVAPDGMVLGNDRDSDALELARKHLANFGARFVAQHGNFDELSVFCPPEWRGRVQGVVADLGVSSPQLDRPERGFGFQASSDLDMRMDQSQAFSAADIVNHWTEFDIADVIYRYGEERHSRRIARAIIAARPINSTVQLAELIKRSVLRSPDYERHRIHPATRTFQALRIAVNDELGALERVLPQIVEILKPGGRMAIISFHSLEDRIVKQFMQRESRDCICPPDLPVCRCGHVAALTVITRKPITPSEAEVARNGRSRSAKLRIAERLPIGAVTH
jgi:16S rRNA (cytosine1402-N4)-methyltransferase